MFVHWLLVLAPFQAVASPPVMTGMDRLAQGFGMENLRGKRVGVLAHSASTLSGGVHGVDWLANHPELELKMIFAPEHGFRGQLDSQVPDYTDEATGLPVYSLYGPRPAPEPQHWDEIDILVADLQDVGVRFYTYGATLAWVAQSAKRAGKPLLILDRPNPLGGHRVEGPQLEKELQGGLTALYPIPLLHGMTLGELLLFYNQEHSIGADIRVVQMQGWNRSMGWTETGLRWTPPSPALIQSDQAILYSVFGALESLKLAVGRGVSNHDAFRVFGAPWISAAQADRLVSELRSLQLPDFEFEKADWIPTRREYQGEYCRGFRVLAKHPGAAPEMGFGSLIRVLSVMHSVLGDALGLDRSAKALGARWLIREIREGGSAESIEQRASAERVPFELARQKYLLY